MSTRKEKIRKLHALARDKGASKHEAALALEKAQELEAKTLTAKAIAHIVAQLLEARGLKVRVRRMKSLRDNYPPLDAERVDVDVSYYCYPPSRGRSKYPYIPPQDFVIEIHEAYDLAT